MKTKNNYIYVKKIEKESDGIVLSNNSDIIEVELENKKRVLVHEYMLEPYSDGYFCLEEDIVAEL